MEDDFYSWLKNTNVGITQDHWTYHTQYETFLDNDCRGCPYNKHGLCCNMNNIKLGDLPDELVLEETVYRNTPCELKPNKK